MQSLEPAGGIFQSESIESLELADDRRQPQRRTPRPLRTLTLILLALLLVGGGSVGLIRQIRPCLLGLCPVMQLNRHDINFTNNNSQPIIITNTGTAD